MSQHVTVHIQYASCLDTIDSMVIGHTTERTQEHLFRRSRRGNIFLRSTQTKSLRDTFQLVATKVNSDMQ